jgi:hypothetical protein
MKSRRTISQIKTGVMMVCILILMPLTISMLVVAAVDAYKARYPEPDLSLCPLCSQPVPHNR